MMKFLSKTYIFLVFLFLYAPIAVLIFFRKDIFAILKALYFGFKNKNYVDN